jgi:hypothetical protein
VRITLPDGTLSDGDEALSDWLVLLWRAGLRISEELALQESDLDRSRGAVLIRVARAAGAARSEWIVGRGSNLMRGSSSAAGSQSARS